MTDRGDDLSAYEARMSTRGAMLELTERLTGEFTGADPPEHIIRSAYRTRETLLAQGVRLGLVEATETATRFGLQDARSSAALSA